MRTFAQRPPPSGYSIYPLEALDGVLAYVALDGETVAYCFGADERAAAEAVTVRLTHARTELRATGDQL